MFEEESSGIFFKASQSGHAKKSSDFCIITIDGEFADQIKNAGLPTKSLVKKIANHCGVNITLSKDQTTYNIDSRAQKGQQQEALRMLAEAIRSHRGRIPLSFTEIRDGTCPDTENSDVRDYTEFIRAVRKAVANQPTGSPRATSKKPKKGTPRPFDHLYIDGSFSPENNRIGIGWIHTDHNGKPLQRGNRAIANGGKNSSLLAEIYAAVYSLRRIRENSRIILHTDCEVLATTISEKLFTKRAHKNRKKNPPIAKAYLALSAEVERHTSVRAVFTKEAEHESMKEVDVLSKEGSRKTKTHPIWLKNYDIAA